MKKHILLFTILLSLCLSGCEFPKQSTAPIKQPVIETPNPSAARIPVGSSVPFVEAMASPAQALAPNPTEEPAAYAVPESSPTEQPVPIQTEEPIPVYTTVPIQTEMPAPLPTSAPAASSPNMADTGIIITKNPTSEALAVGGNTWFVAHAENAQTLTWQLVDPEGNLHTVQDAVAKNPGLGLEVLEDDMIAVSDAPLSFNGWGIQARFDGQGQTAITSPAYIFVGDYINAYNPIIEKYRKAKLAEISNFGQAYERDVSEWVVNCEHVGYTLTDLDKNGVPELLIAGIDSDNLLLDLYSFSFDKPVRICMSTARARYYLYTGNRIYSEGSSGTSIFTHEFYTLDGTKLKFQERYFCFYESQIFGPYFYHTKQDTEHFLEQKPDNYEQKIPLSEFPAILESIRAQTLLPALAQIA